MVHGVWGCAPVWDHSVGRGVKRSDREGGRSLGGAHGGDSGSEEGRTTVVHGELHTGMKRPGGRQILELLTVASLRRSSAR
jgi:hypothetical protein